MRHDFKIKTPNTMQSIHTYPVSERTIRLLNSKYSDKEAQKFYEEQIQSRLQTSIEYTERIYKSQLFFECMCNAVNIAIKQLQVHKHNGTLNSGPLVAIWKRGDLTPEYMRAEGTIVHFGKSKLPRAERDAIKLFFNTVLDDYRRCRNAENRANYKAKKIKKQLEEGITNVEVHKTKNGKAKT